MNKRISEAAELVEQALNAGILKLDIKPVDPQWRATPYFMLSFRQPDQPALTVGGLGQ